MVPNSLQKHAKDLEILANRHDVIRSFFEMKNAGCPAFLRLIEYLNLLVFEVDDLPDPSLVTAPFEVGGKEDIGSP